MARKRKGDKVDGWVNLDKPLGMTSTQAVGKIRRLYNAQKAGHAGTLDPLATGILPIALGEATKTVPFVQDRSKTYSFTITWGEQRDTDDAEGNIIATSDHRPAEDNIKALLPQYTGEIEQIPPQFSAIKVDGERAYDRARAGESTELKPRTVTIETLELIETTSDTAHLRMTCGKGTYVRSLARDMAADLGTCGYISLLRRERVGPFTLENAISLEKLEEMSDIAAPSGQSQEKPLEALLSLQVALDDIPALPLKEEEMTKLRNGQNLALIARPDFERLNKAGLGGQHTTTALAVYKDKPIALVEAKGPEIKPVRVLNL